MASSELLSDWMLRDQHETYLHARHPRVECPQGCGILTVDVPGHTPIAASQRHWSEILTGEALIIVIGPQDD